jgi:hypothetical protein
MEAGSGRDSSSPDSTFFSVLDLEAFSTNGEEIPLI